MAVEHALHVTLSGDRTGDYIVIEEHRDGSLVVAPETQADAMLRRHGMTPSTLEEWEAEYGPVQLPDGEG